MRTVERFATPAINARVRKKFARDVMNPEKLRKGLQTVEVFVTAVIKKSAGTPASLNRLTSLPRQTRRGFFIDKRFDDDPIYTNGYEKQRDGAVRSCEKFLYTSVGGDPHLSLAKLNNHGLAKCLAEKIE